jgi:hypothetical protein
MYFFSIASEKVLGPTQWVPGAFSSGVKRRGREADPPSLPSAGDKNNGSIPPRIFSIYLHSIVLN